MFIARERLHCDRYLRAFITVRFNLLMLVQQRCPGRASQGRGAAEKRQRRAVMRAAAPAAAFVSKNAVFFEAGTL
jgi:hypothetical protein